MVDLATLSVLLVEDNELDARMLNRALQERGETRFRLVREETIEGALGALRNGSFDCILLDLSLPDADGLDGLSRVLEASPNAPVVVLTGLTDPVVAVKAVERGAHDFLPKSGIDADMLARSIRYAVTRHQSEVDLRAANERLRVADDRERIAQDLHDTVIQQLFATGMGLQALTGKIADANVRTGITTAVDNIDASIRQLREAIFDLTTPMERLGDEFDEVLEQAAAALGFSPTVSKHGLSHASDDVRSTAATVLREALSNVAKHAQASSVQVDVSADPAAFSLTVIDDGVGIAATDNASSSPLHGRGLDNLRRRAEALGGSLQVQGAAGEGTTLVWHVPLGPSSG